MRWFLLTLRVYYVVPAAIVWGVLTVGLRNLSIAFPLLSGGDAFGDLPLDAVVPVLICVMVGTVHRKASTRQSAASVRTLSRMLIVYGVVVSALYVATYTLTVTIIGAPPSLNVARSMCGYFAILVFAHLIFGLKYAPMVPVLYLFLSTLFARGRNGVVYPWGWPVQDAQPAAAMIALAIATLVTAYALINPPSRV